MNNRKNLEKSPYIEEQLGETEMGVPTGASYVPDKS